MALTQTFRADTFDQWRINTNTISTNLGDIANISVNIVNRTDVVVALNDLISYIGSATLTTTAQNLRAAVNEVKDSALTFAGAKTFSGAVQINNTLGVTGTVTAAAINGSNISASGTLSSTGNFAINTNKFNVVAASGNTTVAGTFGVTLATTLSSTLSVSGTSTLAAMTATTGSFSSTLGVTGDFAIATNKFNVTAASGNTSIAGTLGVTGASSFTSGSFSTTLGVTGTATMAAINATNVSASGTLSSTGNFAINTNKFNVTAASGNTTIAGTLGVTLATTLAGLSATTGSFSSTLGVSGTVTNSGLTILASTLNDSSLVLRLTNSHAAFTAVPNRFTIDTAGNVVINGNLSVAGSSTLSGTVATNVDWSTITNKPSPVVGVTLTGPITGSGTTTLSSLAGGTYTASFATTITAGSVTLGTHTTGNYVSTTAAGTGISLAGSGAGPYYGAVTITNSDRGSSQNIFKAVAVSGQSTINASTNTDTLTFAAGANVTLTTNTGTKTVTIAASVATPNDPLVTLTAGTGMSGGGTFTLNQAGTATITLTNADRGSVQNIFKTVASAGSTSLAAASNTDTLTLVAGQISATNGIAISLNTTGGQNVVISHFDTSTMANTSNSLGVVLQNLTFDTYGHVLTAGTVNLDSRYLQSYTETSTFNDVTTRGNTTSNGITVGALTVSGSGNASVGGNLTVTGNLTVNGTTSTVNATTISVADPIITLGGTSAPGSDDGKDRGLEMRYFSGSAKIAGLVRRSTNGRLTYYSDATNTSEVFSGTLGTIEAATFIGALTGNASTATALQTARNINGVAFDGTGNITVTANTTNTLTIGTGLSGTSFNGSGAVTIALAASGVGVGGSIGSTSVIPILTYDTYGRLTAVSSSGSIVAGTAATLATPRTINGVSFDGSTNITVTANTTNTLTIGTGLSGTSFNGASAVTIALAASGVGVGATVGSASAIPVITYDTYGRITAISTASPGNGTLTLAVSGTGLSGSQSFTANQSGNATFTVTSNATNANTASTIVARDASGNFSAGTITATLSGNASSASSVAWTNVSGRPTALSSFTNDTGYITSGSSISGTSGGVAGVNLQSGLGTGDSPQFATVYATGDVIAFYSDSRLKTVIGPITGALGKVQQLNGFYYKGNEKAVELGYDNTTMHVGVSAQAVESVLPEIVHLAAKSVEKGLDYKTVDYSKLTPLLIEAIKELANEVATLKQQLAGR